MGPLVPGRETSLFSAGAACSRVLVRAGRATFLSDPCAGTAKRIGPTQVGVRAAKGAGVRTSTATSVHTQFLPTGGPSPVPSPLQSLLVEGHNYFQILLVR